MFKTASRLNPLWFPLCNLSQRRGLWFPVIVVMTMVAFMAIPVRMSAAQCVAFEQPSGPSVSLDLEQPAFPGLVGSNQLSVSVELFNDPRDPSRWYVLGHEGVLRTFTSDTQIPEPILDITDRVIFGNEPGAVAAAFHPDFPTDPRIFIRYSGAPEVAGDFATQVLSSFTLRNDGVTFDPSSEVQILKAGAKAASHHGAMVDFGPDGLLYTSFGDGSRSKRAQDPNNLEGTIVRIDVDNGVPYAIPPDNPFVGGGGRPEIFAYGFRNPYKGSVDQVTGELWVGDVGSSGWEEVDKVVSGGNYGWPIREGAHCFKATSCQTQGLIDPFVEYSHDEGTGVIGGFVYRGSAIPSLQGSFVFADFGSHKIYGIFSDAQGNPEMRTLAKYVKSGSFIAFGEDQDGELYGMTRHSEWWFKLVPGAAAVGAAAPDANDFPQRLSETGCVEPSDPTQVVSGVQGYRLNTPLWSDDAGKRRWVSLPPGEQIEILPDGDMEFPTGTVLIKEFSYQGQPHETRLFMLHQDGEWGGYSYEWLDDLSDAVLLPGSKTKILSNGVEWTYPSRNQCFQCHTDVAGFALGPELSNLNSTTWSSEEASYRNQLTRWEELGMFEAGHGFPTDDPANMASFPKTWDQTVSPDRRARAYLHVNCSGCHRPGGPTPVSMDLRHMDEDGAPIPIDEMRLCDQLPQTSDLGISGARLLDPGRSWKSLIRKRMLLRGSGQMPPLGTELKDRTGLYAMQQWISDPAVCDIFPDTDGDGITDNADNCTLHANVNQRDSNRDGIGNACDADFNDDGATNSADLMQFKQNFGRPVANSDFKRSLDLNSDDVIDRSDYRLLKKLYGKAPGPSCCERAD